MVRKRQPHLRQFYVGSHRSRQKRDCNALVTSHPSLASSFLRLLLPTVTIANDRSSLGFSSTAYRLRALSPCSECCEQMFVL